MDKPNRNNDEQMSDIYKIMHITGYVKFKRQVRESSEKQFPLIRAVVLTRMGHKGAHRMLKMFNFLT